MDASSCCWSARLGGQRAGYSCATAGRCVVGMALQSAGGAVIVRSRRGQFWEVELPEEAVGFFERHGIVPLPPYIQRPAELADRQRYQSVWARAPGAVAAPTASLHFDAALLAALAARGVQQAFLTLHVGAGTLQPLRTPSLDEHVMHAEHYRVGAAAVAAIERSRAAGGRVLAVGIQRSRPGVG